MPLRRRDLLSAALPLLAAPLLPGTVQAAPTTNAAAALGDTDLVYITPLKRDGRESRCQAEVWFTHTGKRVWVVTAKDAWRNRALDRGLARARVWVGDVGQWKDANGRYRRLPSTLANVRRVTARAEHARVLELFGDKYTAEWLLWGPRFRNGLADGSRVLLQYDLV